MATPLINGQAYSYSEIAVSILNVPITGVSSISYSTEQEKTNNYGLGNNPVSRGKGVKEHTASMEISMNDINAIRTASPTGSLVDIPAFDIVVTYLNAQGVKTDTLENCEFTNDGTDGSQGDTDMRFTFNFTPSNIIYGTT